MRQFLNWLRVLSLRARLRRVTHEIEEVERFRANSDEHLDTLTRAAANIRAEIWFSENPRPAVGTTLRCLQGRR